MRKNIRHIVVRWLAVVASAVIAFACANIGNPNGGPYDETPPRFVSSNPEMNQLRFKGKKIEVVFDEFISVDNPSENVIVTPPQKQSPFIQAVGKKINVELKDSLKENTTYTIDFTSSVSDNNEKNVLENFSFAFSTGDVLDSMQIGGMLINAYDLEPVQKVIVGIHSDMSDTAFTHTPLLRTSKTDERGRFVIHNVAHGAYHVFALEDKNRNYSYDKNNDESLAFLDSLIIPWCERAMVSDTIWRDTITVDTVRLVERTLFYPKDLLLWYFKDSITPRQRMLRPDRPQDYIFTLKFNAPVDTFPMPQPLNFEPEDTTWYVTQHGQDAEGFAINYWVLDSAIYKIDTLLVSVTYWKNNDTVPDLLELQTDTLTLVNKEGMKKKKEAARAAKRPPKVKKRPKDDADSIPAEPAPPPHVPLQMTISPSGELNPYDEISIVFNEPVMDVRKEFFIMEAAVDTLWEAAEFEFEADSIHAMTYRIRRPLRYDEKYRLTVDSALLCGVYGHCNDSTTTNFTVKGEKEYGHLSINVQGLPSVGDSGSVTPAFVELLNASGSPVRRAVVEHGVAMFANMPAEKYYARLTLDVNGNGRIDAGNYELRLQPERVVYFPKQFEIRQNWKIEELWDISLTRPYEKPVELLKNKPKEETKKKRDYKEESKPQRGSSGSSMGLGRMGM
ncbi:MAG: Ig-like domain-containing protein [Tannerella sp.]|nr:Ig-like domain-containing protein [Tannerella sp.]